VVGAGLGDDAYLFSNDPAHAWPWNPDWVAHRIADAADAAGGELDIKGGRHYTASQLLVGGFDLRNTAAYLAQLTAGSAPQKWLELTVRQVGLGLFVPKPNPHPATLPHRVHRPPGLFALNLADLS
jgi:hypothetical protein